MNRADVKSGENKRLAYYWFQQRGRIITNEYLVKWFIFCDVLTKNRADGDVIVGMITKDTFMEAVNKLSKEAYVKLDKMTQDLFYLRDVYSRLMNCLHEIRYLLRGGCVSKGYR